MARYGDELAERYAGKGALIDTNLLLLLVVGRTDPSLIAGHKRLQAYDIDDFTALCDYVARFARLITTPHVMAETSNLLGRNDPRGQWIAATLSRFVTLAQEDYVRSERGFQDPASARFGLVDAIIKLVAARGVLLISDDRRLVDYLASHGLGAVNFNHIRPL